LRRVWAALERRSLDLFHAALALKARDAEARLAQGSCLVLAPHPDDETLGCGGLVRRRRSKGWTVRVAVAADGAASHASEPTRVTTRAALVDLRRRETLEACRRLGVPEDAVAFFGLPDGRLAEVGPELERRITDALAAARPRDVFVCARVDGHPDHRALNAALRRLIDQGRVPANVFEYPVWAFDFRSWRAPGRSNKAGFGLGLLRMARFLRRARVISLDIAGALDAKRRALAAHRSQLGLLEQEPDWSGLPRDFLDRFFKRRELFLAIHEAQPSVGERGERLEREPQPS
jgi:LmbE family N-acetylglucosaminyl deacetylase